jgi:hypothetical protein
VTHSVCVFFADGPDLTLPSDHTSDTKPTKDQIKGVAHVVALQSTGSASSDLGTESGAVESITQGSSAAPNSLRPSSSALGANPGCVEPVSEESGPRGPIGPNSLCPVVAFASFAAQLSFKMVLHLAVFGGGCRYGVLGGML